MLLRQDDKILFQGDSVTDCGRPRDNDSWLGAGYPAIIQATLMAKYPQLNLSFINRGISGDKACSLKDRWTKDCVELKPTILSVLIGINDTWRRFDSNQATSAESYAADYREVIERALNEGGVRELVLMDPFVLPSLPDRNAWRDDLNPRIEAVRNLAREYAATYVPLDGIFAAASMRHPCAYWAADGVHPTRAGHGLIASEWIKAVEAGR